MYSFKKNRNVYDFITDNFIVYQVKFSDGSYYFNCFPEYSTVYDFTIRDITIGGIEKNPFDIEVEKTIVAIMSLFLSEKENCVIYICDDSDNRHNARERKYDGWFSKNDNNKFEKFDLDIKVEDSEILSSLIVPR